MALRSFIHPPQPLKYVTTKHSPAGQLPQVPGVGVTWLLYKIDPSKRGRNCTYSILFLSRRMAMRTTLLYSTIKCHMGRCVSSLELLQLRASGCYHLKHWVRFNRSLRDRFNVQQLLGKIYPKGLKMKELACLQRGVSEIFQHRVFSRL